MTIKKFIDRPLLSIVINVMVVAVGIIALTRLPIEKFPDIAPPATLARVPRRCRRVWWRRWNRPSTAWTT